MATSAGRKATPDTQDAAASDETAAEAPTQQVQKSAETDGGAEASSGTDYLNVSGGPLVYDKEGHQVDADGWTGSVNLDAVGKAARSNKYLLPRSAL